MGKEHKEYTWNLIAKKLAGEATPQELRELEVLLRNNPELHYPVQTIADLWEHTSSADRRLAEEAFGRHLDRIEELNFVFNAISGNSTEYPEKGSKHRIGKALILVSSLAAVFTAIWFFTRPAASPAPIAASRPTPAGREIVTNTGSRTRLTLPDSTHVWINAGSRIQYAKTFGQTTREVNLTGEAFFDVAPDPSRPFVIHTAHVDIRVLGTSFNIKSYPTDKTTEATLIRGSIEVSIRNRPSDKIILQPNEKLVVSNEDSLLIKIPRRREIKPESIVVISKPTYEHHSGAMIETSWVDNKLIFQAEPFSDLARQMERWYGVTIRFENPAEEDLQFTGTFEKETIRQALDALKLTARFDYRIEGNEVTIYN
jgi:transmembrane sensor